jgi:hypothetical protein
MGKIRGNPAEKWVRKAAGASADYDQGIRNPRVSWQQATAAAAQTHAQATTAAIARGAFAKGVARAGDSRWSEKATKLGASRFGQGVAEAQNDYAAGFQPYASVIDGVTAPPRGPKGDPRNLERVAAYTKALRAKKIGA